MLFVWRVIHVNEDGDVGLSLPAQESYNEAHQQNAQPLHYLPAGTNILAFFQSLTAIQYTVFFFKLSVLSTTEQTTVVCA